VGRVLRQSNPNVRIVAIEPAKSAVLSGGSPSAHRIDGIGAGFVPPILDRSVISEVRTISEEDAQQTKLDLALREGLLVGISAGANVRIALELARELGPGKTVVTVLCDTGERYFSSDQQFLPRATATTEAHAGTGPGTIPRATGSSAAAETAAATHAAAHGHPGSRRA